MDASTAACVLNPLVEKDDSLEDHLENLKTLATWYRGFAERAGSPTIWDARLRTAEDIDVEIARIERLSA
jgi:hypothetical protein